MTSSPHALADPALSEPRPSDQVRARRGAWSLLAAIALLLAAGSAWRVHASIQRDRQLDAQAEAAAVLHVQVGRARPGEGRQRLALSGTLRSRKEASIHARSSGYLRAWHKDLGDTVRRGDLLAEIDAPEADQELRQARAAREQVRARLGLARSSLDRWKALRARDAVSQQELDERLATLNQGDADLEAAEANIRRLEALKAYRHVRAPFDGVVVRRNADIGDLITAGGTASQELFQLADVEVLKVSVSVPQAYANRIQIGQEVQVRLSERVGPPLKGRVSRSAGAVDPQARAMAVEVEIDNRDAGLLPGTYVDVGLDLRETRQRLTVPASALQFRQDGPRLALVGQEGRVRLRTVKLGRDLGRTVEIDQGLDGQDVFILNPPDTIAEGDQVAATPLAEPGPAQRPASAPAGPGGRSGVQP